jgi:hypothetical protein
MGEEEKGGWRGSKERGEAYRRIIKFFITVNTL